MAGEVLPAYYLLLMIIIEALSATEAGGVDLCGILTLGRPWGGYHPLAFSLCNFLALFSSEKRRLCIRRVRPSVCLLAKISVAPSIHIYTKLI